MDATTALCAITLAGFFTGLIALALVRKRNVKGSFRVMGASFSFEADDREP